MKAEAAKRKGGDRKSEEAKNQAATNCGTDSNGETREKRARGAGTNKRYIDDADKLAAVCPKLAERVLSGEITLPEATALRKRLEEMREADRPRAYP
jgi:hypothetical protein